SPARLKVDVGGYRAKRAAALAEFAQKAANKSIDDQTEVVLEPMTSADRKVVHDALSEIDGIETRSVGTDPRRRVVIAPFTSE
ncbi:MAG: protein jag, partial [Acidimicrobiia bacterium]